MPRLAGQSDAEFDLGQLAAKVKSLEDNQIDFKKDIRETRDSQLRMESKLTGALWATGTMGSLLGFALAVLSFFGLRKG